MTGDTPEASASPWPADPASAWEAACAHLTASIG